MRVNRLAASAILALPVLLGMSGGAITPGGGEPPARGAVADVTAPARGGLGERTDTVPPAGMLPPPPAAPSHRPATTRSPASDDRAKDPPAVEPTPRPTPTPMPTDPTGYVWPLRRATITQFFADNPDGFILLDGRRVHDGIDLATHCGDQIRATHDGTVLYAGRRYEAYLGYISPLEAYYEEAARRRLPDSAVPIVIVTDDENGYHSIYAHFGAVAVEAGERVEAGQVIGWEGMTGLATGCHLHYGIYAVEGPWVAVAPTLVPKWHYPPYVRLRIDPLSVLPRDVPGAGRTVAWIPPPDEAPRYVATQKRTHWRHP